MKILIAGFGSIGRRHFRNLITLGEHDILFYRTHHSTLDADELTGFTIETDLNKALAHRPQAVIVSNPTALHLDVAIPAAEMGCHIFMEKPLSHSMEGIDDLAAAIKKGGGQFLTGFQFRFHPGLITTHDLLRQNAIGKVISATCPLGRIPARLASLGRLPPGIQRPRGPGRWCGIDPLPPSGLSALADR